MSSEFFRYLPSSKRKNKFKEKDMGVPFISSTAPSYSGSSTENKQQKTSFLGVGESIRNNHRQSIDIEEHDILIIDRKIRQMLSEKISTLPELTEDLKKTLWIQNNGQVSQTFQAKRNAVFLRRRIRDLESTMELGFYILRTTEILEEYRQIVSSEKSQSFVVTKRDIDPSAQRKEELCTAYFSIAKEYIDLSNFYQKPNKMKCPSCAGYDFTVSIDEDSIYICSNCHTEIELLDEAPSFKDANRVNLSSKYTYSKKGHFNEAIQRLMGTQNTDPEKIRDVVLILKREMERHNLVAERGKKNSVTKDNLYMFLSEQSLSNHYGDINLLFYMITGEPCHDISHLVDVIREDFDKFEEGYKAVQDPTRINSLNVDWKLYVLLVRRGYPCKKDEDFYILKTKDKEDEHITKTKEVFDYLGWDWINI